MAINYSYPDIGSLTSSDRLLVIDTSNNNATKTTNIGSIVGVAKANISLQDVLDVNNTATQDINLTGQIVSTSLTTENAFILNDLNVDFDLTVDGFSTFNEAGFNGNVTFFNPVIFQDNVLVPEIQFENPATSGEKLLKWNNTDGTLDLGLKGGNVTLQIGQELVIRVVNGTGAELLEAQYRAVKVIGAQGQRLRVGLAQANSNVNSATTIGLVTETIANNQEGFITTEGTINKVNTTGSLQGETWSDGDILYLSATIPGALTNVKPITPAHLIVVGFVEYAHASNGKIYVKVDNGYELEDLHDVRIQNIQNGELLVWNNTSGYWFNDDTMKVDFTGQKVLVKFGNKLAIGTENTTIPAYGDVPSLIVGYNNNIDGGPTLQLRNTKTNTLQGDTLGRIQFTSTYTNSPLAAANIKAVAAQNASGGASGGANIIFETSTGLAAAFPTERMRITSAGDVGIGTTSPGAKLDVNGNVIITTSGSVNNLLLTSTDTTTAGAPDIVLYADAPAVTGDTMGDILFQGQNGMVPSPTSPLTYTGLFSKMVDKDNNHSSLVITTHKGNGSGAQALTATLSAKGVNNSATGTLLINPSSVTDVADYNLEVKGDALIQDNFYVNGDVGIGTTSPSEKLHVSGNARVTGAYYDSNNSAGTSGQVLSSTATGTDWVSLSEISGVDGTGTANYVAKWSDTDTITNSVIYDNGTNVGIGTTSPGARLEVKSAAPDTFFANFISSTGSGSAKIYQDSNSHPELYMADATGATTIVLNSAGVSYLKGGNIIIGGTADNGNLLQVQGTSFFYDNVGIGTVSPTYRLDITGNDNIFRLRDSGGLTVVDINGDAGAPATLLKFGDLDGAADNVKFTIDTQQGNFLFENGFVGIGTASPGYKLDVDGGNGIFVGDGGVAVLSANSTTGIFTIGDTDQLGDGVYATNTSTSSFDIYSTGSIKFRMDVNGNVGIGTTTPSALLDVNGDALINGLTVGKGAGTSALGNTVFGKTALNNITTGFRNVAIGNEALLDNATGNSNIAIGYQSLENNLANSNVAIGVQALENVTTAGNNTAVGHLALGLTSGANNTAIGNAAGYNRVGGTNGNSIGSVFIGSLTYSNGINPVNEIVIGTNAISGGSNTVVLGNDSIVTTQLKGNVGIGTTTPSAKLDVNGGVKIANDSSTAAATNVGTLRYRTSGNNSYVDMCMQTGASTYAWVNIVQNNW
jgi:hypothetical protein